MSAVIARSARVLLAAHSAQRIGPLAGALIVALAAALTFLIDIGEPDAPFWDENYYLTAIERYHEGIAQFASHPPLGLMLLSAGDALVHPNRGIDTSHVGWDKKIAGENLPKGYAFTGVRLASAVFAVLGAIAFYGVLCVLTESAYLAVLFSSLYVFENAFAAHFRAAHLDAFQLAFVIVALFCFVLGIRRAQARARAGRSQRAPGLDVALGAALGLAVTVKVNAIVLGVLGVMLVLERVRLESARGVGRALLAGAGDGLTMTGGFALAVALVMTLHVAVSPHPPVIASPAGEKDWRFITPVYRDYLQGRRALSPAVVLDATEDYVRFMGDDFRGIPMTDPNGSQPLEWPLQRHAINYRWDSDGHRTAYMQLVGNPASWSLALLALLAAPCLLVLQRLEPRPGSDPVRRQLMLMLLVQYVVFMAVHMYLGLQRVMYMYHYFIGLTLAFCLVPLVLAEAAARWAGIAARLAAVRLSLLALIVAGYAWYFPLSYHVPMTKSECEWRNLVQHVVECR